MISLSKIIDFLELENVIGNADKNILNAIQLDTQNDRDDVLMWVSTKFTHKLKELKKGVIICSEIDKESINDGCTYLITDNPRLVFQKVLTQFFTPKKRVGISKTAIISSTSTIGSEVFIGNNVVIEENCSIGYNTIIDHNTVIKNDVIIGNNVIIGSNNVIGGVGFGYEKDETGQYVFIPHLGNVIIGNNVEIGNNTCIDKAVLGSTIIEDNAKIDNLVHIAHGVVIGQNSLIIANAMIAGSVVIGKSTWVAPSVSILNQKRIGDNVTIGLAAVVLKDVLDNETVIGNPAEEISEVLKKKRLLSEKIYK
jgi:UDP-3-O-[3-hydroxymyristoyl] glucosamine N-acyltransferase